MLALTTAEALGEVYPTLGEIGLDVGIDRDGRLWILEVNRQPGRSLWNSANQGAAGAVDCDGA